MNRNWIETLTLSLPDYAGDLEKNIIKVMNTTELTEHEAHVCALAAAMASGNDRLVFEISMDKKLFGDDVRELAAKAVLFEATNARYICYTDALTRNYLQFPTRSLVFDDATSVRENSPEMFGMLSMVASIVFQCEKSATNNTSYLRGCKFSEEKLHEIAMIACVIPTIGVCLL